MINKKLVIFLFLLTELQIAHAASFDCRQPLLPDEKEICSSQELNDHSMESPFGNSCSASFTV